MQNDVAPASVRTFEIAYQKFAGNRYNLDFRGKGSLEIHTPGQRAVFSGKKRQSFSFARTVELDFAPEQIWNVAVEGRRVQFATREGKSGSKEQPFVFFCRTAEDAASAAALLPEKKDADFVAGQQFEDTLRQLRGPTSPWASVTNIIVGLNVAVFLVMGFLGAGWIEVADVMPYIRYGANRADATTDGEWWRLATCMFMHYGVVHLLLNMWALLQAGHLAEKLFGRRLYALAYIGSGLAGSIASLLWHREKLVWSAGASGAVFGVYGALLGYMLREKHALPKSVFQPLLKSTLAFAGYNLFYGMLRSGIDNAGHVGGLAGGVLLGWLLALPANPEAQTQRSPARLRLGLIAVAVIVAVGGWFAPRYDYRLMDEFAWQELNKEPRAKEPDVMKHQQAVLTALAAGKDRGETTRWLAEEAIPFYQRWKEAITAIKLETGRRTDKRRAALVNVLRLKVDSFEHLLAALRGGDANAISAFENDQRTIAAELATIASAFK